MLKLARKQQRQIICIICLCSFLKIQVVSADDSAELTKKLQNPVASLISVPFQYNYDVKIGPNDDGERSVLNFQPVVPISISEDWNIISRTILPLIDQNEIIPNENQFGLGDTLQSLFFSPKEPTSNGLIWGVGPALLLPTSTNDLLGANRWALGPTFVALKQSKGLTYGALGNHLWSVDEESDKQDVNSSYFQPFVSYATQTYTTFTLNTESTYNWEETEWNIPVNFTVSQVLKIYSQPISIGLGARYWAKSSENNPEGLGARAIITFLFPK